MEKTKIDWCDSSWNPVTGCLHSCKYCYARSIANRFSGGGEKWTDDALIELNDRIYMNQRRLKRIHMDLNLHCIDTGLMNTRKRAEGIFLYALWQIFLVIGFLILGLRKFFLPAQKHRNIIIFS